MTFKLFFKCYDKYDREHTENILTGKCRRNHKNDRCAFFGEYAPTGNERGAGDCEV